MSDWSLRGVSSQFRIAGGGSWPPTQPTVTAGSANTKGSWVEMTASTPFETAGIIVYVTQQNGPSPGSEKMLLDVGIGGAGSEIVIVPNVFRNMTASGGDTAEAYYFPISIPAGSRIAVRIQCETGSKATQVVVGLFASIGEMIRHKLSKVTDYGTNTGTSSGTTLTASASAHTKGSWTELSASVNECKGLVVIVPEGSAGNQEYSVDVGVGAGGSEVVIISDIFFRTSTSGKNANKASPYFPVSIPSGTRLAARCQSSTAGSDTLIAAAYGVG